MAEDNSVPKVVTDFSKDVGAAKDDGRLDAPAFHRNRDALLKVISNALSERMGNVIEIGSGTGQHAMVLAQALPNLQFQPTDIVTSHLRSIDAWRQFLGAENVSPAISLDVRTQPWAIGGMPIKPRSQTAILCFNVIHISPWAVAQNVFLAASKLLMADGFIFFYGPFMRDGQHTAPSNQRFDETLRAKNPAWGVRDIADLKATAEQYELKLVDEIQMPANNLTLVFQRA